MDPEWHHLIQTLDLKILGYGATDQDPGGEKYKTFQSAGSTVKDAWSVFAYEFLRWSQGRNYLFIRQDPELVLTSGSVNPYRISARLNAYFVTSFWAAK